MTFSPTTYFETLAINLKNEIRGIEEFEGVKTAKYPFNNPSLDGARIFAEKIIGRNRVIAELGVSPYLYRLFSGRPMVEMDESDLVKKMVSKNLAPNGEKAIEYIYGLRNMKFDTSDAGILTFEWDGTYTISLRSKLRGNRNP